MFPFGDRLCLNKIPSSYSLFTTAETSKVMLVFKLNKDNYKEITLSPKYRKMLDIVAYFEED